MKETLLVIVAMLLGAGVLFAVVEYRRKNQAATVAVGQTSVAPAGPAAPPGCVATAAGTDCPTPADNILAGPFAYLSQQSDQVQATGPEASGAGKGAAADLPCCGGVRFLWEGPCKPCGGDIPAAPEAPDYSSIGVGG